MSSIAQVQKASATAATNSVTATFGATPTPNNLLIAVVLNTTDTAGGVITGWTVVPGATVQFTGANVDITVMLYKIAGVGESTSVTATASGATLMELAIFEYSGLVTSLPVDKVATAGNGNTSAATSQSSGTTAVTSQPLELAIAAVGTGNSVTSLTWSNSFTAQVDTTRVHVGDKILAAPGAQESTASWTTARVPAGLIVTFVGARNKPASRPRGGRIRR